MNISEHLLKMKDTLLFKGWTQQSEARDEFDDEVEFTNPHAVSYCMTGAMSYSMLADGHDIQAVATPALDAMARYLKRGINTVERWYPGDQQQQELISIPDWNDDEERTLEEVIQVVDLAIGFAKDDGR